MEKHFIRKSIRVGPLKYRRNYTFACQILAGFFILIFFVTKLLLVEKKFLIKIR